MARIERDGLGDVEVPDGALYGVHTVRAQVNFAVAGRPVHVGLWRAFGAVKQACAETNARLGFLSKDIADALSIACGELRSGDLDEHNVTDALQGGAGTSTNMNVNEVLANRTLQIMGKDLGDYATVDPLDHVNLHQSTNDTYPTALRVAALDGLNDLEVALVRLLESFQDLEKKFSHIVKMGRTQLQDAVLTTLGRSFGAYADCLARDRWRVFKCAERLRVVNLGGTAIGTGIGAPRQFIFQATDALRALTGHTLARAENLVEATQNQDALVEVMGILKACAVSYVKIGNDLRLLSSGPDTGLGEIKLPVVQAGSSIMPGKVNPVIPEAVAQAGLNVMGLDHTLSMALAHGNLDLHQFMPLAADCLLGAIDHLTRGADMLVERCLNNLEANEDTCQAHVDGATATVTALAGTIGYHEAEKLAQTAKETGKPLKQVAQESGIDDKTWTGQTSPEAAMRLGSKKPKP